MHSFCRGCLIRSLYPEDKKKVTSFNCPTCSISLGQKPHAKYTFDRNIQGIVDKLFPHFAQREQAMKLGECLLRRGPWTQVTLSCTQSKHFFLSSLSIAEPWLSGDSANSAGDGTPQGGLSPVASNSKRQRGDDLGRSASGAASTAGSEDIPGNKKKRPKIDAQQKDGGDASGNESDSGYYNVRCCPRPPGLSSDSSGLLPALAKPAFQCRPNVKVKRIAKEIWKKLCSNGIDVDRADICVYYKSPEGDRYSRALYFFHLDSQSGRPNNAAISPTHRLLDHDDVLLPLIHATDRQKMVTDS